MGRCHFCCLIFVFDFLFAQKSAFVSKGTSVSDLGESMAKDNVNRRKTPVWKSENGGCEVMLESLKIGLGCLVPINFSISA